MADYYDFQGGGFRIVSIYLTGDCIPVDSPDLCLVQLC